ncbi:MAG: hypothetical protein O3C40_33615 [Planctomycetota bacterium]|nr:hypothetical protein [Planctomycetota bacterium]
MSRPKRCRYVAVALAILLLSGSVLPAQDKRKDKEPAIYPVAILPFQEHGRDAAELGAKVTDLLFAQLIANRTCISSNARTLPSCSMSRS